MDIEPIFIVHGGAWDVPDAWIKPTLKGIKEATVDGYKILQNGGSSLDAVESAIKALEDNEYFNAGRGCCLNLLGNVALDASIQRGSDLEAGCVTLIDGIRNPITLARKILEYSPHSFLGGEGAKQFALEHELEMVPSEYFITNSAKKELDDFKKTLSDTVGAIAMDMEGNVVAGTSTGGVPGKYLGRIGDSPQIGSGTYADNLVGAACSTGHGESISKICLAHKIIKEMESGKTAQESVYKSVNEMTIRLKNTGGAIAISNKGDVGYHFTTKRMSWCYIKNCELHFGIDFNQHEIVKDIF